MGQKCAERGKDFASGLTVGDGGSHMTLGVMDGEGEVGTQRVSACGRQGWLAARVSSWCLSVFQAKRQRFAYSAKYTDVCHFTRDHLEIMSKLLGEDSFAEKGREAGIPGPLCILHLKA